MRTKMKILNRNTHKHKFDRRRALECKLIEKSKSSPGYLKYEVTIGEKDGTIHKQPVYGKDMQNALSRLLNQELTVKVERKLETSTGFIFLAWLLVMGTPVVFIDTSSPWFLMYVVGVVATLVVSTVLWYNYIKKGE
jgi:hypothetical protein